MTVRKLQTIVVHTRTGAELITRTVEVINEPKSTALALQGMVRVIVVGEYANPEHPNYMGLYAWAREEDLF